jgi:activator of 2-hydroxyglutaryl-CoA dehydratase
MTTKSFPVGSTNSDIFLGFDIGSVSLNTIIIDHDNNILEEFYDYVHGRPFNVLKERLSSVLEKYSAESITGIAITGTGGKLGTELIGGVFVNEIIAQATSAGILYPEAKTVIEIGGEDSKLIILEKNPENGHSRLVDF